MFSSLSYSGVACEYETLRSFYSHTLTKSSKAKSPKLGFKVRIFQHIPGLVRWKNIELKLQRCPDPIPPEVTFVTLFLLSFKKACIASISNFVCDQFETIYILKV